MGNLLAFRFPRQAPKSVRNERKMEDSSVWNGSKLLVSRLTYTVKHEESHGANPRAGKLHHGKRDPNYCCHVGCHCLGWCLALGGGRRWEQPGAAQEQPRAAQSSQESSGTALGEPRATQDTLNMTLSARSLGRQISPQTSFLEPRKHPKSSKSAR